MVFWESKIGDENNFSKLGLNSNLICGLATLIFFVVLVGMESGIKLGGAKQILRHYFLLGGTKWLKSKKQCKFNKKTEKTVKKQCKNGAYRGHGSP
jgi:hypothetical protein